MDAYDPLDAPDPEAWLALDEIERMLLVERQHKRAGVKMPNRRLHAAIHVVLENQLAEGEPAPARETLARLMEEGLDRHQALHAMGTVLTNHMFTIMKDGKSFDAARYDQDLRALTAEAWRCMAEE